MDSSAFSNSDSHQSHTTFVGETLGVELGRESVVSEKLPAVRSQGGSVLGGGEFYPDPLYFPTTFYRFDDSHFIVLAYVGQDVSTDHHCAVLDGVSKVVP